MTASTVTIDGRRYTVGVDWTPVPAEDLTRAALRDLVKNNALTFGYRMDPAGGSDAELEDDGYVMIGLASRNPVKAPSAAMRLTRAVGSATLFVAALDDDDESDGVEGRRSRYWVCGIRDGLPDPASDVVVDDDALISTIRDIVKPWAARDIDFDQVAAYTNDEAVAEENNFDLISFEELTEEIDYTDLPKASRLVSQYNPARLVVLAVGVATAAYIWFGLIPGETPEKSPPEPDVVEDSDPEPPPEPDVPTWQEKFADVQGHLDNILDVYGAGRRIESAMERMESAPRVLAGWQMKRLVVTGGETATLVYQRNGRASLERLLDRLETTHSISFGDKAQTARVQVQLGMSDKDHDVARHLDELSGQWSAFADELIRVSPGEISIVNVREQGENEASRRNRPGGKEEKKKTEKVIRVPELVETEKLAGKPLVEQYRWELSFRGNLRLERIRRVLENHPLVALEVMVLDLSSDPKMVNLKGVIYEGA